MRRAFTLLELIIVIVILGILATLAYNQYTKQVESSRLAEAQTRIGTMRQLTLEYYMKYGTVAGIQNSDVEVDSFCHPDSFYGFWVEGPYPGDGVRLFAQRCVVGGKTPNAARTYYFYLQYYPGTGQGTWCCYDPDSNPCFGYPVSSP
jgi:prepilin-type N-terminal cleavage/methylation domain-containing protein